MEDVFNDFFIATGTIVRPSKEKSRKIINKKLCPVSWFLLIEEICTSGYSGTRSHRRLIFRIMKYNRMYTLCTTYENN